jgi:broad specificity phosphatase PhoE
MAISIFSGARPQLSEGGGHALSKSLSQRFADVRAVILVRHSESAQQPDRNAHEWSLTPRGRRRAASLARMLEPLDPDAVLTSLEPKAVQTGEILGSRLNLDIRSVRELGEHDRTDVPFLTADEFERLVRRSLASLDERVFGGESAAEALARFSNGLHCALDRSSCRRPLVVTHGTVMSLYVARLSGTDPWKIWQELSMPSYVDLLAIAPGQHPEIVGVSDE